jgi:hypothetical protein
VFAFDSGHGRGENQHQEDAADNFENEHENTLLKAPLLNATLADGSMRALPLGASA